MCWLLAAAVDAVAVPHRCRSWLLAAAVDVVAVPASDGQVAVEVDALQTRAELSSTQRLAALAPLHGVPSLVTGVLVAAEGAIRHHLAGVGAAPAVARLTGHRAGLGEGGGAQGAEPDQETQHYGGQDDEQRAEADDEDHLPAQHHLLGPLLPWLLGHHLAVPR